MISTLTAATISTATPSLAALFAKLEPEGKWAFIGALALVLIWLVVMPKRLVEEDQAQKERTPWWRSVRFWAIVICVVQIWIYWRFG